MSIGGRTVPESPGSLRGLARKPDKHRRSPISISGPSASRRVRVSGRASVTARCQPSAPRQPPHLHAHAPPPPRPTSPPPSPALRAPPAQPLLQSSTPAQLPTTPSQLSSLREVLRARGRGFATWAETGSVCTSFSEVRAPNLR